MVTNEHAFQFADDSLKNNREFILAALKVDPKAFQYINDSFKKDKDILKASAK